MASTTYEKKLLGRVYDESKVRLYPVDYNAVMNLDVQDSLDFICRSVEGNCVVNLVNATDGDSGVIELIMDSTGGYTVTLGSMFTKRVSVDELDTDASADNFVVWQKICNDIVYSVMTVQT